jgi:thiamine kinase-like enzyme
MFPDNKVAAVKKALQTAFGTDELEEIQRLVKGLSSALVFKIIVDRQPYLLRVVTSTDAVANPSHYYGCMQAAANAGIAPPIFYLDIEDRISITGFVNEKPFSKVAARKIMPELIQKLHSLPKFPYRMQYFEKMEGFMDNFKTAGLVPDDLMKNMFDLYGQIAQVYPRYDQESWVSCHNDLKPENIIFDGTRPWFVDWEAAFLNDPYLDLSMVANFVLSNWEEEKEFLQGYLGKPAGEYEHARLFLMQMILHAYYFIFFIMVAAKDNAVDVSALQEHNFRDFHDRILNHEISLANNMSKLEYGMVHHNEFLRKAKDIRLKESLVVLSTVHKKSALMNGR